MNAPENWTSPDFDPTPCACGCGRPLGDMECANERGEPSGVHADCWAAYCAGLRSEDEDRRVDREQERRMFHREEVNQERAEDLRAEWGSKS